MLNEVKRSVGIIYLEEMQPHKSKQILFLNEHRSIQELSPEACTTTTYSSQKQKFLQNIQAPESNSP